MFPYRPLFACNWIPKKSKNCIPINMAKVEDTKVKDHKWQSNNLPFGGKSLPRHHPSKSNHMKLRAPKYGHTGTGMGQARVEKMPEFE